MVECLPVFVVNSALDVLVHWSTGLLIGLLVYFVFFRQRRVIGPRSILGGVSCFYAVVTRIMIAFVESFQPETRASGHLPSNTRRAAG